MQRHQFGSARLHGFPPLGPFPQNQRAQAKRRRFFLKPAGNVTIAYNLIQHGEQRGLNAAVGLHPAAPGTAMQLDAVNNVIYHFVSETGLVSNQFGNSYANFVGNTNLRGPRFNAGDGNFLVGLYGAAAQYAFGFDIHAKDNVTPHTRIAGQFGQTVTDFFRDLAGMVVATNNTASTVCGSTSLWCARMQWITSLLS